MPTSKKVLTLAQLQATSALNLVVASCLLALIPMYIIFCPANGCAVKSHHGTTGKWTRMEWGQARLIPCPPQGAAHSGNSSSTSTVIIRYQPWHFCHIAPPSPWHHTSDYRHTPRAASLSRTVLLKFCKNRYKSPRRHGHVPESHEGSSKPGNPGPSAEKQRGELGWDKSLEDHRPPELAGRAEEGLPEASPKWDGRRK